MINRIETILANITLNKPLVLCITNLVTMDFVANSLLAIGAAPIMSVYEDEVEELVKTASAVYINIGTLDDKWIHLSRKAVRLAKEHEKPVVLDPVGAGATAIRTQISTSIAPFAKFIRGNSSEIISLANHQQTTYGVEATRQTEDAEAIATELGLKYHNVIIVSGPIDFITNGHQAVKVPFGSKHMQQVTGMGCSLTAVIAAFQSAVDEPFDAALFATYYFALCGEIASEHSQAAGGFKTAFLDQLHRPELERMRQLIL